jgi:hypothetical protein
MIRMTQEMRNPYHRRVAHMRGSGRARGAACAFWDGNGHMWFAIGMGRVAYLLQVYRPVIILQDLTLMFPRNISTLVEETYPPL